MFGGQCNEVQTKKQCMNIVRVTEAQVMYLAICKTCKRMKDGIARFTNENLCFFITNVFANM